jgi:hypothetical protein
MLVDLAQARFRQHPAFGIAAQLGGALCFFLGLGAQQGFPGRLNLGTPALLGGNCSGFVRLGTGLSDAAQLDIGLLTAARLDHGFAVCARLFKRTCLRIAFIRDVGFGHDSEAAFLICPGRSFVHA